MTWQRRHAETTTRRRGATHTTSRRGRTRPWGTGSGRSHSPWYRRVERGEGPRGRRACIDEWTNGQWTCPAAPGTGTGRCHSPRSPHARSPTGTGSGRSHSPDERREWTPIDATEPDAHGGKSNAAAGAGAPSHMKRQCRRPATAYCWRAAPRVTRQVYRGPGRRAAAGTRRRRWRQERGWPYATRCGAWSSEQASSKSQAGFRQEPKPGHWRGRKGRARRRQTPWPLPLAQRSSVACSVSAASCR